MCALGEITINDSFSEKQEMIDCRHMLCLDASPFGGASKARMLLCSYIQPLK